MGVSTMSDYERNVATAPFGQALGRAGTVAVDEGLRAYMLRIYNYMVLGLAITGAGRARHLHAFGHDRSVARGA